MAFLLSILSFLASIGLLVLSILILIHAFKKDTIQGVLTLLVPFYIIYYVIKSYRADPGADLDKRKTISMVWFILLGVVILLQIIIGIVVGAAAARAF